MFTRMNADGNIVDSENPDDFKSMREYKPSNLIVFGVPVSSEYNKIGELITLLHVAEELEGENPGFMAYIQELKCDSASLTYHITLSPGLYRPRKDDDWHGNQSDTYMDKMATKLAELFFASGASKFKLQCGDFSYSKARNFVEEEEE